MRGKGRKLPIGAVAERYGVPATTLRYWEQIGLLPAQERVAGQRRYDLDAVRRIKFIRMAARAGLSLEDIRTLLAGHVDRGHGHRPDGRGRIHRERRRAAIAGEADVLAPSGQIGAALFQRDGFLVSHVIHLAAKGVESGHGMALGLGQ